MSLLDNDYMQSPLDSTAATCGQNGVPEDPNQGNDNDENNENRNRTLTRLRYYNQPEPAAGTDEQILEKVDQASRGGTVEFNEAMYARLKQMTAGHIERYH